MNNSSLILPPHASDAGVRARFVERVAHIHTFMYIVKSPGPLYEASSGPPDLVLALRH